MRFKKYGAVPEMPTNGFQKENAMKNLCCAAAVVLLCLAAGCVMVIGAGAAGAGVYSYVNGELKRAYPMPYKRAIRVCNAVAAELKITISERDDTGIVCTLKGKQNDDTPVTIRIQAVNPKTTEIGVRVGVVGLWDRNIAESIHNYIEQRRHQPDTLA
jgi:hypothetical protein